MELQGAERLLMQVSEGFQPHVLELPVSDDVEDGVMLALVLVIFRRKSGLLLAVPEEFIAAETLAAGMLAGPEDIIGPSQTITVPAGVWDPVTGGDPVAVEGEEIAVVLVDCLVDIQVNLKVFDPGSDPVDIIQHFSEARTELFPLPLQLQSAGQDWVEHPESGDRVNYYSAAEEKACGEWWRQHSYSKSVKSHSSSWWYWWRKACPPKEETYGGQPSNFGGIIGSGTSGDIYSVGKPGEETVRGGSSDDARRKSDSPCSSFGWSRYWWIVSSLDGETEPVPDGDAAAKDSSVSTAFASEDYPCGVGCGSGETFGSFGFGEGEPVGSDLAKAVLAQSQALTALVGQIAQQADPLADVSSSSTTFSSRGAMGRARLQQELAAHRGVFFHSVCQNMARRMYPSQSCDMQPLDLLHRGVSATRYLERFGG